MRTWPVQCNSESGSRRDGEAKSEKRAGYRRPGGRKELGTQKLVAQGRSTRLPERKVDYKESSLDISFPVQAGRQAVHCCK